MAKKEKVVIITPTYNEVGNVGKHIDALQEIFKKVDSNRWDMHILIVDDTSPDGTAKVVREKMKTMPNVYLLMNKEKIGLGGAYMKGMNHAVNDLKAEVMFEMDADFQHDPELIPQFLAKIGEGADIVVGSRYMKGGGIPKNWGFSRKVLSVGGNLFIRLMMLDNKVHDWTTGFRALRPWVFEKINHQITELKTYSFQIQFLYFARKQKAKIAEVPLIFRERHKGESKLPGMEGTIKTFWFVVKMRIVDFFKSRFFKFGTVGFIGYLVNAIFLQIFSRLLFPEWAIWAASTELAIVSNFTLNNLWTFKKEKIKGLKMIASKFIQFNFTSMGALLIQTGVGTLGVHFFGPEYRQILLPIIILFLVLPYNYLMYNLVIWKTWQLPWKKKKK